VGLALAAALIGSPGAGLIAPGADPIARGASTPSNGATSSAKCIWKRHTKRIVKRVKRHGRVRRVKRIKRWWTCRRPSPTSTPDSPTSPESGGTEPAEAESTIARLSVRAFEWGLTLSRPTIPAGEVIVELNNRGEDPHNLNLQRNGGGEPTLEIPKTESLERRTARFTLPAGTYRLWCSLPAHDELGMNATLGVGAG
jgi:hypothetical protein